MKTRKDVGYLWVMLIASLLCLSSCEDRSDEINTPEEALENHVLDNSTEYDVVEQVYNGSTTLLVGESADFMPLLLKRFPNINTSITENSDVIILGESETADLLNNTSLFELLKAHWEKNKPVGFVNPSENTIKLLSKLGGGKEETITKEAKELIEGYAFYMLRADGNAVSYCKPNVNEIEVEYVDSLTNEVRVEKVMPNDEQPSEYALGRIGERAAEWLNSLQILRNSRIGISAASCGDVTYDSFSHKIYQSVTVDHDYLVNELEYGTGPGKRTTEVYIELNVDAGFDIAKQKYVYEIKVSEVFDARKSYIEDFITKKKLAYKYKYTGGNYAGVRVGLKLKNVNANDISLAQATPIGTAGSGAQTYYPSTLTVGGGLSGGADASGPSFSGSLCFSYTPAYSTITMSENDFPIQYNDNHSWAEWDYGKTISDYNQAYHIELGFNPTFTGVPQFSKYSCTTQQAITYMVDAKDEYDGKSAQLEVSARFKTFHDAAGPWGGRRCFTFQYASMYVNLPVVSRYFDSYSPYCYKSNIVDKNEKWSDVEYELRENPMYKLFYNENLQIGSPTKGGLGTVATEIWTETINSLINQLGQKTYNNEYIVGLANSQGKSLMVGLHIKAGKWELVQDITQVQLEEK